MIATTRKILQVQNPCPHYAKQILYTRLFAAHSLNVKGLSNDTIQSLLDSLATPPPTSLLVQKINLNILNQKLAITFPT